MFNDWDEFFVAAVKAVLEGHSPYSVRGFYNPPWLVFLLAPLAWIPPQAAIALPGIALLIAAWHRHKPWIILMVGLSFPFLALSLYANVDWIAMLGIAFGGALGPLLVTTKPQAAGFAILAFWKQSGWKAFIPLVVVVVLSFILWPTWPADLLAGGRLAGKNRNMSLFPYTIPLGVVASWLAWRRGDVVWGCIASLSFAPYFYIHSLTPLLFALADRKWWLGLIANLLTWGIVALNMAGIVSLAF